MVPLTIGLGPNFIAGDTVDLAIETSWDRLGAVITSYPTLPLAGEPRTLGGIGRARFVYAPVAGRFTTAARIGDHVGGGALVATIGPAVMAAPITGVLRGLTRDGAAVPRGAKVIEVDPRDNPKAAFGLGERPKRIAAGVLAAIDHALIPA
jgi:xanthine dehydrogenase accessory factor